MVERIQLRRDTSSNWTTNDPILAQGEIGIDLTENRMKIGDGTSLWSVLEYMGTDLSTVEPLPEFPDTPKSPFYYLLDDNNIWYYTDGTSTWTRTDKVVGKAIELAVLNNGVADEYAPSTYPKNTVKMSNQSLPSEVLKLTRRPRFLDGVKRSKGVLHGVTSLGRTGGATDYVKITVNNGSGTTVFDNIWMNNCDSVYPTGTTNSFQEKVVNAVGQEVAFVGNDGNPLRLQNKNGRGYCGSGVSIQINYGSADSTGTFLTALGLTDGQSSTGTDGATYQVTGSGWYSKAQLSKVDCEAGLCRFFETHEVNTGKSYKIQNWCYDKDHNIIRFNRSTEILQTIKNDPSLGGGNPANFWKELVIFKGK